MEVMLNVSKRIRNWHRQSSQAIPLRQWARMLAKIPGDDHESAFERTIAKQWITNKGIRP